jgi:hypothetical protein
VIQAIPDFQIFLVWKWKSLRQAENDMSSIVAVGGGLIRRNHTGWNHMWARPHELAVPLCVFDPIEG